MGTAPQNLALPGNPRYQPKSLIPIWGYDNLFRAVGMVELATLRTLAELGYISAKDMATLTPEKEKRILSIRTTAVDKREREVTKHDVRAWVQLAQEILPRLARWIHVPLTSYDALDTARILQFIEAHDTVLETRLVSVAYLLTGKAEEWADVSKIGRTHGQHAVPITAGFWAATIDSRFATNIVELHRARQYLYGGISGPVGGHNATVALDIEKRSLQMQPGMSFEERVLKKLGLKPAPISTQILPPEPLAYYLHACLLCSATLAQLGCDCRQLMRTEIAEIGEPFGEKQSGSSTMVHKRNPITFENLVGMFLRSKAEYLKVLDTLISEHQRDLVGSSLMRDFPIIVINLVKQLEDLLREDKKTGKPFIKRITINTAACRRNLELQKDFTLAEPLYLSLQMAGFKGDAYELVNHCVVERATRENTTLLASLEKECENNKALATAWKVVPESLKNLFGPPTGYTGSKRFGKPSDYSGKARALTHSTCARVRTMLAGLIDPLDTSKL